MTIKHILIVDDDRMLRMLVTHTLSAHGFHISEAGNGQEALGLVANAAPDLILLDGNMPVMDGMETLGRLKADSETSDIPVVMLTARREESATQSALEAGAAGYLTKPFNPDDLVLAVQRIAAA